MLDIAEAGKTIGLQSTAGKISLPLIKHAPLPCILHWNQNHFVVLYKIANNHFYLADPAIGFVKCSLDELENHWACVYDQNERKGFALFLEPTSVFYTIDIHENWNNNSLHLIFRYFYSYKSFILQIVAGIALGCVIQMLMPLLTQSIVDKGIRYKDMNLIWLILVGQLMLICGGTLIGFIRNWLVLHISTRINISLISDFIIRLLQKPMSFFDSIKLGDLLQRIEDNRRIQRFLTTQALSYAYSMISVFIMSIMLWKYSSLIFLVFLFSGIIYFLWMVAFLNRRRSIDNEYFTRHTENSNCTYQLLTTMQEIKLQNCGKRRRWEWENTQVALFDTNAKTLSLQQMMEFGGLMVNESKNIIITVLSATAVIKGELTLGMMMAIQNIVGMLNNPVMQLNTFLHSFQDLSISLERIDAVRHIEDEDENRQIKKLCDPSKGIVFRNVSFKYNSHSPKWILEDIDMVMAYGKVTAIVGSSGCGKTTLMKLILGFYPPTIGELEIGGQSISQLNMEWWRGRCGVVMQESTLFSDTIARNIAVNDYEIDYDKLKTAIAAAGIEDFINQLPMGLDTKIGNDGMGVSQGQKQRILIARIIYRNPEYIFLDEATNSLDALNENKIVNNLKQYFMGKTVIIAAHRLSTVRDADNIVVMEKGKIVECGSHQNLICLKGRYFELVRKQLEN